MKLHLKTAEILTHLLDKQFSVLGMRFGIDPIVGLIPGIGDLISFCVSLYIIWIALQMRLPRNKISKMTKNIIIDLIIGAVPIVGDFADFVYKANSKNLLILQSHTPVDFIEGEIISDSTTQ
jgi:hypothetical protein